MQRHASDVLTDQQSQAWQCNAHRFGDLTQSKSSHARSQDCGSKARTQRLRAPSGPPHACEHVDPLVPAASNSPNPSRPSPSLLCLLCCRWPPPQFLVSPARSINFVGGAESGQRRASAPGAAAGALHNHGVQGRGGRVGRFKWLTVGGRRSAPLLWGWTELGCVQDMQVRRVSLERCEARRTAWSLRRATLRWRATIRSWKRCARLWVQQRGGWVI